jgi:phosphatidylglycerophosphatase A
MKSILGDDLSLSEWIVSGAGSGHIKPANGTWGSLFGLGIGLMIYNSIGVWPLIIITILYAITAWIMIPIVQREQNIHDPSWIVADEIVAVWMILCLMPINTPLWILGTFIGFRFLDIVKPWPISALDRGLHNATGVMIDDIVAALIVIFVSWGIYVGFAS